MDELKPTSYREHRFLPEIISHAIWLYFQFGLSFRDVEDLLAERGITGSYETIRQWSQKFGSEYARKLKRKGGRLGQKIKAESYRFLRQRSFEVWQQVAGVC